LGYLAVAFYYRALAFTPSAEVPNVFFLLRQQGQTKEAEGAKSFGEALCFFYASTFLLLLGFELGVGARFIAYSLFYEASTEIVFGVAIVVYGIVVAYTYVSGLRAAVQTDAIQFIFIVLLVGMLPFVLSDSQKTPADNVVEFTSMSLLLAALSVVTAITTQFYSIVNPQVATSHSPEVQFKVLIWAGVLSGAIYFAISALGFYFGSIESLQDSIRKFLYRSEQPSVGAVIFVVALFMGMLAVLLSTLDNVTVAVSQLVCCLPIGHAVRTHF
jgi:Na+/proline symporter